MEIFINSTNVTLQLKLLSKQNVVYVTENTLKDTNGQINSIIIKKKGVDYEYGVDIYIDFKTEKVYTNNIPEYILEIYKSIILLYPITFSIPEEKITSKDQILCKDKIISSLIPGDTSTYIYNTEEEYYNEYKRSYFANTRNKAGWDCMRHYEIMANGCIPYFPNIEECPPKTMHILPKKLMIEANTLYKECMSGMNDNNTEKCRKLSQQFLEYTRNNLTTTCIAKYILTKTGNNIKSILYLSGHLFSDYLRCLTLHGFKKILGAECHDSPKVPHMYKNHGIPEDKMWGKGYSYNGLLEDSLHNNVYDSTIEQDIKNKKYDIVIYGSYHRGMPHYDLVMQNYSPNKVILLCGEDLHQCNYKHYTNKGHFVFVREL